jgi:hypothetical protein
MEAKGLSHFPFFPIVNIDSLLNVIQYISYTNAFIVLWKNILVSFSQTRSQIHQYTYFNNFEL